MRPAVVALLVEADHERRISGLRRQPAETGIVAVKGRIAASVGNGVARERELRKDDEVGTSSDGLVDEGSCELEIGVDLTEHGRKLGERDPNLLP